MSEAKTPVDVNALMQAIPYAQTLGITVDQRGNEITTVLHFQHSLIGNPVLPAIHGGVIGAFLETTAIAQLAFEFAGGTTGGLPKPIGLTIDYLRSGRPVDTFGRAEITKQGRRVATVRAEAWQEDRSRPIAAAHGHFLLQAVDDAASS